LNFESAYEREILKQGKNNVQVSEIGGGDAVEYKIDFVIPWVDGNDPEWQEIRNKYAHKNDGDNREIRYRDWDNLQYWFRGVERFTPWVNKIHFITWGHLPPWLDTNNPKLNIVYHEDYIPEKYLPTFNSHTIELNLHRIRGLSDRFVYFNDDTFIIRSMDQKDFFRQGLPCDSAVIRPYLSKDRNSIGGIVSNNMAIINTTYDKNTVIKQNFFKWFNLRYKKQLLSTFLNMPYGVFTGFFDPHLPNSYLKSTFEEVWEKEYEVLNDTCTHKFRDRRDVNQWLIRYWQLVKGNFAPRNADIGVSYSLSSNNEEIFDVIKRQKYKMICLNDSDVDSSMNFEKERDLLKEAFNYVLPEKSSFEI